MATRPCNPSTASLLQPIPRQMVSTLCVKKRQLHPLSTFHEPSPRKQIHDKSRYTPTSAAPPHWNSITTPHSSSCKVLSAVITHHPPITSYRTRDTGTEARPWSPPQGMLRLVKMRTHMRISAGSSFGSSCSPDSVNTVLITASLV